MVENYGYKMLQPQQLHIILVQKELKDLFVQEINNGLILQYFCCTASNLTNLTLSLSYNSDQYVALCNIIANANEYTWNAQVNIKNKTSTTVYFPGNTSCNRQLLTIGS